MVYSEWLKEVRNHGQEFPLRSFLNRLTSFISELISSSVNSGVSPLSAADRRLSNAARALAAASSSSFALMGKGMLLLRMTALTKMLMAVFALIQIAHRGGRTVISAVRPCGLSLLSVP